MSKKYDFIIIGAGIIGLSLAYLLKKQNPKLRIAIFEKEQEVAMHASSRNSGVLHAGFYYHAQSLKAKLTKRGNALMKEFCKAHHLFVRQTQKLIIAQNQNDLAGMEILLNRARLNGVELEKIDQKTLLEIDSNAKSYEYALLSPSTASVDPKAICLKLKEILLSFGVDLLLGRRFRRGDLEKEGIQYGHLINCAGMYADAIAHEFGIGLEYTMIPFKGIYYQYTGGRELVRTHIYPVPNLANPFLGVHFTLTHNGSIKIGPSAIPAFWRENYLGFERFNLGEFVKILLCEGRLFCSNAFGFRSLALEELKHYQSKHFIQKAANMLHEFDDCFIPLPPGIRAQLLDTKKQELVQDFVILHHQNTTHILNAISPAFTCSFAFGEYVLSQIKAQNANHP